MKLRIINRERLKAQVQVESSFWVGINWYYNYSSMLGIEGFYTLHIFICAIPMLPLHITMLKKLKQHPKAKT